MFQFETTQCGSGDGRVDSDYTERHLPSTSSGVVIYPEYHFDVTFCAGASSSANLNPPNGTERQRETLFVFI